MTLTIDPKGTWRSHRFEFCNALDTATDPRTKAADRAKAWAELNRYGIKVSEWQPIETAPKDGTEILAWVPDPLLAESRLYAVVHWHNGTWTREGDDYDLVVEPTHWQPLPTPPALSTPHKEGER